jgi:hypothetical protein
MAAPSPEIIPGYGIFAEAAAQAGFHGIDAEDMQLTTKMGTEHADT